MLQADPTPALGIVPPPPLPDWLPYDDGIPMESQRHRMQMDLLVDTLYPWIVQRPSGGYAGGNMFVYFSPQQVRNQDYKGPDVFAVLDVPVRERTSWIVWEEGKGPDVVIELLSASTATHDKTQKKLIYQNQLRVPEYIWYDPFNPDDFEGFALQQGIYEPVALDDQNRWVSQQLQLALVRWIGEFKGLEIPWLRWATLDGVLLPTEQELTQAARQEVQQETQRAEQERQRAEQERQRADRLAEELKKLGIDPTHLP